MSSLRYLSIILAIAATVALIGGTFGLSGVSAERNLHVSVVPDEQAYIGFDEQETNPENVTITITNRYSHTLEVTVNAETAATQTVGVGTRESFIVEVNCNDTGPTKQRVTVAAILAESTDHFATLDRTVEIPTCSPDDGTND